MKNPFYIPVFGNVLGWLIVLFKRPAFLFRLVPLAQNDVYVTVYTVESFPIMKTIKGQAVGQYMFIRSDIKQDTLEWKRIFLHEMKHVQQQCEHGWFGIWFFIKYYFQFVVYTVANMGIVSIALKNMPLEKEAYATEAQLKPIVSPKSV